MLHERWHLTPDEAARRIDRNEPIHKHRRDTSVPDTRAAGAGDTATADLCLSKRGALPAGEAAREQGQRGERETQGQKQQHELQEQEQQEQEQQSVCARERRLW